MTPPAFRQIALVYAVALLACAGLGVTAWALGAL